MTTTTPPRGQWIQYVIEPSSIEPPRREQLVPRRVSRSPAFASSFWSRSNMSNLPEKDDLSPVPTSVSKENNEQQQQQVPEPRRSKRERHSTVVYVGNQAVKKSNNYVLKGFSYEQDTSLHVTDRPRKRTTLKQLTSSQHRPKAPTTVLSQQEKSRRKRKDAIQGSIQAKQERRYLFLQQHLTELEPFCQAQILQQLQQHSTGFQASTTTTVYYEQPKDITAELRDYQLEGMNWMSQMYSNNVGMILGDEMGLGKTLQTIALFCHIKERLGATGPSLIICPLSVLYSWCNEIAKWAPSLKFLRFHSSNPENLGPVRFSDYDMIVTTYEMAKTPSLAHVWRRQHFTLLVLDEGHKIKSAETQISQAVRKLHAENRIILTGTPLANNLVELWSLLNFLLPDVFTTCEPFAEAFDLSTNHVDPVKLEQAHRLLKVFMLRRLKSEVEKLMPKKIETKVICPLSNTQIWWYKAILLKDIGMLARGQAKANILNNLIMQLRKCCLHPYLFPGAEDVDATTTLEDLVGASGKLAVLDKLLCSLYKKGHRVVLFSQFTQVLDILDDYASMRGWKYCRLDGSTARAERNFVVNSFNAPDSDKFIFFMSTRSGGMGLNLQTADTCILFDSDWNPMQDEQAMARVHRIGQRKTVHVYRLVTEGTVEVRIVERAEKKLYLDRMVTRDGPGEVVEETEDAGRLMSTLKFGCNAVFGQDSKDNSLPTNEDIEIITDRSRTEDFSQGKLKGGTDASAEEFDETKKFTATTEFGGIDFSSIRDEYKKKRCPNDMGHISEMWNKRQRKNRIKMIEAAGSGYGSKAVPVLAANEYDLETGEPSVFQKELRGRDEATKTKKDGPTFSEQDFCQACGDGGYLVCCPRCPVSLHLECAGISKQKDFQCCSHHHCSVCAKPASSAGGFLFPCSTCPSAYCEDHLPAQARVLEQCDRMEALGYMLNQGVYVHCSKECEQVAIKEFNWKPQGKKEPAPCPPLLEVANHFGGEIDDSVDAPEELIVNTKRRRKEVNYRLATSPTTGEEKKKIVRLDGAPDYNKDKTFEYVQEDYDDDDEETVAMAASPRPLVQGSLPDYHQQKTASSNLSQKEAVSSSFQPVLSDLRNAVVLEGTLPGHQLTDKKVKKGGTYSPRPSAYSIFFRQEKVKFTASERQSMTFEQLCQEIDSRWQKLCPEEARVYKDLAKSETDRRRVNTENEYYAIIPVTPSGLNIAVEQWHAGGVVFRCYRRLPDGSIGPAEKSGAFRGRGDQIIEVDDKNCETKPFEEVLDMLKSFDGKKIKVLRMRQPTNPMMAAKGQLSAPAKDKISNGMKQSAAQSHGPSKPSNPSKHSAAASKVRSNVDGAGARPAVKARIQIGHFKKPAGRP